MSWPRPSRTPRAIEYEGQEFEKEFRLLSSQRRLTPVVIVCRPFTQLRSSLKFHVGLMRVLGRIEKFCSDATAPSANDGPVAPVCVNPMRVTPTFAVLVKDGLSSAV